jgi:hypothetical protein
MEQSMWQVLEPHGLFLFGSFRKVVMLDSSGGTIKGCGFLPFYLGFSYDRKFYSIFHF